MSASIQYEDQRFIIVNDLENSTFYFFDFDRRSRQVNMEFEHLHTYFEIHILLSPSAIHFLKGVPYQIHCNDLVLLPPSMLHKTCYTQEEPSKRLIISFLFPENRFGFADGYEEILRPFYNPLPIYRFTKAQFGVLATRINQITQIARQETSQVLSGASELLVHSIFTQFLCELSSFSQSNLYHPEAIEDKVSEQIYSVSNYIHTHYSEELSLDQLAREACMSPYYLSHQFRRITGYTLTHYIHLVRVRNCQFLLLNSSDTVSRIAFSSGFNSFSQFNRVFRKFCGESPSDYRRNHHSFITPPPIKIHTFSSVRFFPFIIAA